MVHNSWRANEVGQDSRKGMRVKFIPYSEYKYERLEKGGIRIEIRSSRPISPSADTTKNRQGEIFEKGGKFGERSVSALHLGKSGEIQPALIATRNGPHRLKVTASRLFAVNYQRGLIDS